MMDTQAASRWDEPFSERGTLVPISPLESPPSVWKRSYTVESTASNKHTHPSPNAFSSDFIGSTQNEAKQLQSHTTMPRQEPGAPLAQVLNNGSPTLCASQDASVVLTPLAAPFNGRLRDLLLNSPEAAQDERKTRDQHVQTSLAVCENSLIKLPKLPQLPKKATRRPRIPPLLQGLHQPPPLPPEGKLFPPIIGESSRFRKDVGLKVGPENGTTTRNRKKEETISPGRTSRTDVFQQPQEEENTRTKVAAPLMPISETVHGQCGQSTACDTVLEDSSIGRRGRKRRPWSEQETKDLLIGVSKFGIGNWKKILHYPDFAFHGRTAVDLKDRFRVCCPGEGLRPRKTRAKKNGQENGSALSVNSTTMLESANTHNLENSCDKLPVQQETVIKQGEHKHVAVSAKLAMFGIESPFVRHKRRKRREFSAHDDANLLKGFERYGAIWHSMRDDTELDFGTRHPTDLRDRFRIRYPEMYARAGYKLKPKDEQRLKDQVKQIEQRAASTHIQSHADQKPITDGNGNGQPQSNTTVGLNSNALPNARSSVSTPTTSMPHIPAPSIFEPPSIPLEETSYLFSEGDDDESQIVLNRNILQWADAKSSSSSSATPPTPATTQRPGYIASDLSFSMFATNDGTHTNLLATSRYPPTVLAGSSPSAAAVPPYPFLPSFSSYKPAAAGDAGKTAVSVLGGTVACSDGLTATASTFSFFKSAAASDALL